MPVCLVAGEAAAALAAKASDVDVHKVDADELRALLKKGGAHIP